MEQISDSAHQLQSSGVIDILIDDMDVTNLNLEIVPTEPLQLSGFVYDNPLNGKGVEGAHVTVYSLNKIIIDSTDTDSQGHFYFDRLPMGKYSLSASKNGYLAAPFHSANLESGIPVFLTMTLFPERRKPFVYGRVADQAGEPVQNAVVCIRQTGLSTRTNSNGEFALDSVPIGDCAVEVEKDGYINSVRELSITSQSDPVLLPVILTADDTAPIGNSAVEAGEDDSINSVSGVPITGQLDPVLLAAILTAGPVQAPSSTGNASVSGFITNCAGQPLCSAWVGLYSIDRNCLVATTITDYEGHYSFSPVPAGRYLVRSKAAVN